MGVETDAETKTQDDVVQTEIEKLLRDHMNELDSGILQTFKKTHSGNADNLEGLDMNDDTMNLVAKEIRGFRETYKEERKDKDGKEEGNEKVAPRDGKRRERSKERGREYERERERKREREREREREKERERERRDREREREDRDSSRRREGSGTLVKRRSRSRSFENDEDSEQR